MGGCARAAARVHRRSTTRRIPATGAGRRGASHGVRSVGCFAGSGVRQPLGALRPCWPGRWRGKQGPRHGRSHGRRGQRRPQPGGHHRCAGVAHMALGVARTASGIALGRRARLGVSPVYPVGPAGAVRLVRVGVMAQVWPRLRRRRGRLFVATVGRRCGPEGVQRHPQQQENGHQAGPRSQHARILRARRPSLARLGLFLCCPALCTCFLEIWRHENRMDAPRDLG